MLTFDHIAVATTDLAEGTAVIAEKLGVALQPGGKHAHFGTHNTLLNLGDIYLEVIAKDPDAPATGRLTWFGLDDFTGAPRPANWICRTPDFTGIPPEVGKPVALQRDNLNWELTVPDDGTLPFQGAYPSLLRWADGTVMPSASLPDRGCRLVSWTVVHPDAAAIGPTVPLSDDRVQFETGPTPAFRAVIQTPTGKVTLT
ncbi:Glyoxalase-like domain-containing protein [Cognatiyoonia koreensis]|uniref:Glyoxalase-like domain-containing protein n=1 Tax=Cognatiyoonia koreensis TaxID=364200 RepID=A0A1I0QAZ7_9RHOB|nr:VOC family protein [Cognatiyoonia koreensis]SEW24060.1 Glyoxalase-like domain-containing protein [Cognatiyoonia koreensis]